VIAMWTWFCGARTRTLTIEIILVRGWMVTDRGRGRGWHGCDIWESEQADLVTD
jgi:hypothetical protein